MAQKLKTISVLMGVGFTLQGVAWLVAPEQAAGMLGMPALEGMGRSTQFGDFAAFFLMLGGSILAGSRHGRRHLLYFPAGMLACAALCRTLAWAFHGAAFAAMFIAVETLGTLLLLAVIRMPRAGA